MSRLERLEMKKVETKHLQQFNQLLRYVFQVTNHDLQQVGWEEREITLAKLPVLRQADVFGWFDEDKLVSQIAVYPFKINIFGQEYDMGGLTGVGTYPEYSNLGLMDKLMRQALTDMRERKQSISYLFPYSIPYYRRKGWEIISDKISFEIKDTQLPKPKVVSGEVERVSIEHEDVRNVYERFSKKSHASMIRSELAWEEYWRWDLDDLTCAIYYDKNHEAQGYVLYWISDEIFYIKEMVFVEEEARTGLWNFISAHFSMINKVVGNTYTDEPLAFLLEDGDIEENIKPYFMGRIVDIEQFINQYPFKEQENEVKLVFQLKDPLLDWNTGVFTLSVSKEGKGILTSGGDKYDLKLDIQTLTTMLLSYKRPTYLHRIKRITCDKEIVDLLENLIERENPYFSDYF
ncbi:GNAT family N-acetyltransferase [Clostridioides sp. ES-S-0123-01]|uniref:GNAT family N-acetyltransferase n=1 Tax=Clostridioides sp. ES-S-0123-01 TaxID=2770783 RepID=UPI001D0FB3CB|nr:GNAT family N-acetyltransferase [Clostridioides sp. ES-S-0123-01]